MRGHQRGRGKRLVAYLIALLLLGVGGFMAIYSLVERSREVIIAAWAMLFPISILLAFSGLGGRMKSRKWRAGTLAKSLLGAAALILLAVSTVSYRTYHAGCPDRIGPGATLKHCDFRSQDLRGRDLQRADLAGAVLSGANLQQANLADAILTDVNLIGADLTSATLDGAVLAGVDLQGAAGLTDATLARVLNVTAETLSRTLSQRTIRLESRGAVLERLRDSCLRKGVAGAGTYTSGDFHPLVLLNAQGETHGWTNRIADEKWEPVALRFGELVACAGEEQRVLLETCHYTFTGRPGESVQGSITRYRYQMKMRLVAARTATVVAEHTFVGTLPERCPDKMQGGDQESTGGHVDYQDVKAWLAEFVTSRAAETQGVAQQPAPTPFPLATPTTSLSALAIPTIAIPEIVIPTLVVPRIVVPKITIPAQAGPTVVVPAPALSTRPLTGAIIRDSERAGLGELTVENGTQRDGVAVLAQLDDTPLTAFYVRSRESFTLTGIRDGTYRLLFTTGQAWNDDAARFTQDAYFQRFEDTFTFTTTQTPTGKQYSIWKVTLHPVAGGTAETEPLSPDQFPELK